MAGIDPRQIYDHHLRATSEAAMAGDIVGVLANVVLPAHIQTTDCAIIATTSEELETVVLDYAQLLASEGVIDEREVCLSTALVPGMDDMIAGVHETEWHFADGRPVRRFRNRVLLMRHGASWKMMWLQSELSCAELPVLTAAAVAAHRAALTKIAREQPARAHR